MKVRASETVAKWRHNADNQVAPLRRRFNGALTPTMKWLLSAGNSHPLKRGIWHGSGHVFRRRTECMDLQLDGE